MPSPDDFPRTFGTTTLITSTADGTEISRITGNPIAAFLETKDMDFDARDARKLVDRIIVEVSEFAELEQVRLSVGTKNKLADSVDWLPEPFLLSEDAAPLFMRLNARYYRLRIESDSVGVFWRLASIEIFGVVSGRRFT